MYYDDKNQIIFPQTISQFQKDFALFGFGHFAAISFGPVIIFPAIL